MLVLSVKFDQPVGQVLERAGCRECAVDERAAASLRRDLTPDQQLFPAILEDGFNRRGVFAGAYEVARRAASEQQTNGLDEDRLACPRFARQDVQARVEFHLDRVNDSEVSYAQEAEHGETTGTPIVT